MENDENGVEVATAEGEAFAADFALCTFGSGVLDRGSVKFGPPLPDYYTKIFLKFPSKFWGDSEWTFTCFSPEHKTFPSISRSGSSWVLSWL